MKTPSTVLNSSKIQISGMEHTNIMLKYVMSAQVTQYWVRETGGDLYLISGGCLGRRKFEWEKNHDSCASYLQNKQNDNTDKLYLGGGFVVHQTVSISNW